MIFRRGLLCLCAAAIFVFLCFCVILKRSFLSVPNGSSVSDISNSSVGENNESHFADSTPQLPKAKTSNRMNGNSSPSAGRVGAQKNESH